MGGGTKWAEGVSALPYEFHKFDVFAIFAIRVSLR